MMLLLRMPTSAATPLLRRAAGPTAALLFVFRSAFSLARRPPRPLLLPPGGAGPLKGANALAVTLFSKPHPSTTQPNQTNKTHTQFSPQCPLGILPPRPSGATGRWRQRRWRWQPLSAAAATVPAAPAQAAHPAVPQDRGRRHRHGLRRLHQLLRAGALHGAVAAHAGQPRYVRLFRVCLVSCVNSENRLTRLDSHTPKIPMYTQRRS
jgi:hypothetical protein